MARDFKTLRETVLRERQETDATALLTELLADKPEVIGQGPAAVSDLDAFLNG